MIYLYNLGDMGLKFLPNDRKLFDYRVNTSNRVFSLS